ncbi:PspC domain-containing protein [Paenibacillus sp. NPDC058174]|uniref:PspC domain-containing protein n=1 Tax=Paenibacillus sp. NPDC058174 TaxID=3346366 RepID=UPI0036DF0082
MVVLKKLYRSARDKKLFGLCGGLADVLNVDATLLRILLIVAAIFTSGMVIPVYIIAGLVVPKEPPYDNGFGPGPGYGGYGNGYGSNYNNQYGNHNNGSFGHNFGTHAGGPYKNPPQPPKPPWGNNAATQSSDPTPQQSSAQFDRMMDDLEKKALRKEVDELRAKLAQIEKGEK